MNRAFHVIGWFRRLRIVPKLVLGYLVLIIVPFIVFAVSFYHQLYENVLSEYRATSELLVEQAASSMEASFARIESIPLLFQNNTQLTWYLDHRYLLNWEMVYNYQRSISPVFSFVHSSNPSVQSVVIYKYDPDVLELGSDIVDASGYAGPVSRDKLGALGYSRGLWYAEPSAAEFPTMSYTIKVYDDLYTRELGFLQIVLNDRPFRDIEKSFDRNKGSSMFVWDPATRTVYGTPVRGVDTEVIANAAATAESAKSAFTADRRHIIQVVPLPDLGISLAGVSMLDPLSSLKANGGWSLIANTLLLAIPTLLYFGVASSMANRLVHFTRHLKDVDHPNLAHYSEDQGSDEISFLIYAYNSLLSRLGEVVGAAHRAEIIQKEAEIRMLQAQIKPHFLYNTLETMRMLAVVKDETQIAEMAASLGRLLRYSLEKDQDDTTISDEIDNVTDYVQLHRTRMSRRLDLIVDASPRVLKVRVPRFILQPIVENSVLHGISKVRRDAWIRLTITETAGRVRIEVRDNGRGVDARRLGEVRDDMSGAHDGQEQALGIGLRYVIQRVKASFGPDASLSIDSDEGVGTAVSVEFAPEVNRAATETADR